MKTMLMFPGQGSQYVGMGKDIFDNYYYVKKSFEKVSNILNIDLINIIFNGDENILKQTDITQPALMLVSVSIYLALKEEYGIKLDKFNIQGVIGHSLGEYSALCVSGSISIDECAKILQLRGLEMSKCCSHNTGMCAIIGCDVDIIQKIIDKINPKCLVVANYNSLGQIIISGYLEDIEKFKIAIKDIAKKTINLNVSGAFHSPLMLNAQINMKKYIEKLNLKQPFIKILQNYSGQFENDPDTIKFNLINQITSPILWYQNIQTAIENGFDTFIEIGPKNVLSGLVKRCISSKQQEKIRILNIENINDIKELFSRVNI